APGARTGVQAERRSRDETRSARKRDRGCQAFGARGGAADRRAALAAAPRSLPAAAPEPRAAAQADHGGAGGLDPGARRAAAAGDALRGSALVRSLDRGAPGVATGAEPDGKGADAAQLPSELRA